jgi:hypothetical protein
LSVAFHTFAAFTQFVLVPLVAIYLVILMLYLAKVLMAPACSTFPCRRWSMAREGPPHLVGNPSAATLPLRINAHTEHAAIAINLTLFNGIAQDGKLRMTAVSGEAFLKIR